MGFVTVKIMNDRNIYK